MNEYLKRYSEALELSAGVEDALDAKEKSIVDLGPGKGKISIAQGYELFNRLFGANPNLLDRQIRRFRGEEHFILLMMIGARFRMEREFAEGLMETLESACQAMDRSNTYEIALGGIDYSTYGGAEIFGSRYPKLNKAVVAALAKGLDEGRSRVLSVLQIPSDTEEDPRFWLAPWRRDLAEKFLDLRLEMRRDRSRGRVGKIPTLLKAVNYKLWYPDNSLDLNPAETFLEVSPIQQPPDELRRDLAAAS